MSGQRHLLLLLLLGLVPIVALSEPRSTVAQTAPTAQDTLPNIIFIVVDALRADHVSAYGYGRQTTPNVDALLAAQGTLFRDVTTASSWTNPSNGAMLIGRLPSTVATNWADPDRRIPADETLLAEYLADAGYQTAGFVSNWWMREQFGYAQGFDTYAHTEGPSQERASALNDLAIAWLANRPQTTQPLFLFLYYYDPHSWYDPPPPYDTLFDPDYAGPWTPELFGHGEPVVSGALTPTERDKAYLLALYDGEIRYWDNELGRMAAYLDSLGLWQDSMIVLTSDHGQMFGEHGKWVHRNSLYEEVLRVPLLIRYPSVVPAGRALDDPVSNIDILPTILQLIGKPLPADLQGQSLAPLMHGERQAAGRMIFAEMAGESDPRGSAYWIAPHTDLFAVKQNGWKYTHALRAPQGDTLAQVGPASLYEGQNMIAEEPVKAAALWTAVQAQFDIPTAFQFLPVGARP